MLALRLQYAQIALNNVTPQYAEAAVLSPDDFRAYAHLKAEEYQLNDTSFTATIECESHFNQNAIGDHGTSFGIAQIHLSAHPDVSRENALDGVWSIEWAAREFAKNPRIWTCYRNL